MSAVLQDQPLPARLVPWPAAAATPLARCVLLALLLHLWLVLLLGSAPSGTALPGKGVFGAINVTLRGPVSDSAQDAAPAATPTPGKAPESESPRWGGRVRQTERPPDSLPGAESLGVPAPQAPQALPVPSPPQALPVPSPPQALPVPSPPQALPVPSPPQALDVPSPQAIPVPLPALSTLTAPSRPLPAAQALPVPTPERATAAPLPSLPNVMALPRPAAATAVPAPEPVPVPAERSIATPVLPATRGAEAALAREPAAAPLPDLQALPTPGAAPSALRQLTAPPPPAAPRPAEAALPRTTTADTVNLPATPALPTPGTLVSSPGQARPDAGSRIGHDVATPAAAAASQPPRLNLELARPRGGELSRFATSGALPVLPRPPEVDEKLARDIEKSGKADCRKAYASAGVLAVVPLVADAVKGSGCKW